jgi:hypothetical protein
MPPALEAIMKAASRRLPPISIHLERHRWFIERRLKAHTTASTDSAHVATRLPPSSPSLKRSVLPFERQDWDE